MPYEHGSAPNTDAPSINITPARPNAPVERRSIMSSGHVVPAQGDRAHCRSRVASKILRVDHSLIVDGHVLVGVLHFDAIAL